MQTRLIAVAVALSAACSLHAQSGNEVIYVGGSDGGSCDAYDFIWPTTGQHISGCSSLTDNVTDAQWTDHGRTLYIATMLAPGITRCDWDGYTPTFSSFWANTGGCWGLGIDHVRKRLWTFSNTPLIPTGPYRELYCLDIDSTSPTYGTVLAQTSGLNFRPCERWELSHSGNRAIVPDAFINSGQVNIVDTDPQSPNFAQIIGTTWAFGAAVSGIAMSIQCEISIDDQYAFLAWQGMVNGGPGSGLGVLHLPSMTWLDFDPSLPGIQDFMTPLPVISDLEIAYDGSFALLAGIGVNGGAMRVDLDYTNPGQSTATQFLPGNPVLDDVWGLSMTTTQDRFAVTRTDGLGGVAVLDATTGALLHNIPLTRTYNSYTAAWQDASPMATYETFGAGCAGALGTPTLSALPNSLPVQGSNFQVRVDKMPLNLAVMTITLDNLFYGGVPLPFGLPGAPGCSLLVSPLVNEVVIGTGGVGTWTWAVPGSSAVFGTKFYNQAYVLDPGANALGIVTTNAAEGMVGY